MGKILIFIIGFFLFTKVNAFYMPSTFPNSQASFLALYSLNPNVEKEKQMKFSSHFLDRKITDKWILSGNFHLEKMNSSLMMNVLRPLNDNDVVQIYIVGGGGVSENLGLQGGYGIEAHINKQTIIFGFQKLHLVRTGVMQYFLKNSFHVGGMAELDTSGNKNNYVGAFVGFTFSEEGKKNLSIPTGGIFTDDPPKDDPPEDLPAELPEEVLK